MAVNKCVKYLLFFFNLLFWVSLENKQYVSDILHHFKLLNTLTEHVMKWTSVNITKKCVIAAETISDRFVCFISQV